MIHPELERTYLERKNKYDSKVEDYFCFKVSLKENWKKFHNHFGLSEIESDYENNLFYEEPFIAKRFAGHCESRIKQTNILNCSKIVLES